MTFIDKKRKNSNLGKSVLQTKYTMNIKFNTVNAIAQGNTNLLNVCGQL
jgi:hypothetical protein